MGLATFRIRKENEAAKNTANNKEIKKATKAAKRSAKSSK